jgi:glycerol-3-phosphate dehydrogenase (NAD(P)+)
LTAGERSNRLAIIGGGSWGTALAIVLAPKFESVGLWVYERDLAAEIERGRENRVYLPGFRLPANVAASPDVEPVLREAGIVLSVLPSHVVRHVFGRIRPHLHPQAVIVSATKGLENGTLYRMTDVIRETVGESLPPRVVVLSGPTFAREVAAGKPAAVVAASGDEDASRLIRERFSGPTLRVYSSHDPVGVEIGGAVKNVVAIGAGVCAGLDLGHNALAALITRGLVEITRLAVAMGAKPPTLSGLAGLGDLVLTCTGELSRNRKVGLELAEGKKLAEIVGSGPMIAEGVKTTAAAVELADRYSVEMPIARQMHAMLNLGRSPADAVRELMERSLKME